MFEQNMFRIKSCKPPWLNRELQPRTRACVRTVNNFGWNCKHHFLSNLQNVKQNRGKRARSNYMNFRVKGNCEFCAVRREKNLSSEVLFSFLVSRNENLRFPVGSCVSPLQSRTNFLYWADNEKKDRLLRCFHNGSRHPLLHEGRHQ